MNVLKSSSPQFHDSHSYSIPLIIFLTYLILAAQSDKSGHNMPYTTIITFPSYVLPIVPTAGSPGSPTLPFSPL